MLILRETVAVKVKFGSFGSTKDFSDAEDEVWSYVAAHYKFCDMMVNRQQTRHLGYGEIDYYIFEIWEEIS